VAAPQGADLSAFLMQATSDLFIVCESGGRIVALNPAWEVATGWTDADLLGQSLLLVVHPDDHARARAAGLRMQAGERSLNTSWRLLKRNGDFFVASWNFTVVGDRQYSLGRDVSDIIRTEQAFDLAMRQREILECAAGVGSWTYSLGAETISLSPGLAGLLGLHQGQTEFDRAAIEAAARGAPGWLWLLLTQADAAEERLSIGPALAPTRLRLVRASAQADGLVCGVVVDETATITARENAEEARLRLELALDAGRAATWQLDLDTPRLWVSPQFEALIGRPVTIEEMLTGKGAATHPDDVGQTLACTKRLLEGPTRAAIEHRIVRPDGEVRWVQTLCQTQAGADGRINRAVALTVDITERRDLQQQLLAATRQAEAVLAQRRALLGDEAAPALSPTPAATTDFDGFGELFQRFSMLMAELDHRDAALAQSFAALKEARIAAEAGSIAKSQFLANMSHELRTPINAIIGFAELIADDAAGREPQIADDAGRVVAAACRLLAMINELLDLSRMEAGRLTAKPRATDIGELVTDLAEPYRARARANGTVIRVAVAEDIGTLEIDGDRLAQAVRHLLDNAVKFTTGGEIRVGAARGDAGTLEISVSDTGIGMSAEDMAALQAPLTQADGRATRRHGGAGLGLAVARRLADLLGGRLSIASAVGQGSTFTLTAPYHALAQAHVA
jgi:PAS domain S-box-containing protein